MALKRIANPAVLPLTLAQAKQHLRVVDSDEDDIIAMYLAAATDYADGETGFLGRALVTQTWRLTLDTFPATTIDSEAAIKIPLPPLQSVQAVLYDNPDGLEQTVSPDDYFVDTESEPGWIAPVSGAAWPTTLDAINAVRIEFVAGYDPSTDSPPDLAANVPASIKQAILLMTGSMFKDREEVVAPINYRLPFGAYNLLWRYRIDLGFA